MTVGYSAPVTSPSVVRSLRIALRCCWVRARLSPAAPDAHRALRGACHLPLNARDAKGDLSHISPPPLAPEWLSPSAWCSCRRVTREHAPCLRGGGSCCRPVDRLESACNCRRPLRPEGRRRPQHGTARGPRGRP